MAKEGLENWTDAIRLAEWNYTSVVGLPWVAPGFLLCEGSVGAEPRTQGAETGHYVLDT